MKNIIFVPIKDYFISRKKVFIKFLIPILIALIALLLSMFFNIGNSEKVISTFSGFIDTQINIVAILISFSVAIITILVSADNKNIPVSYTHLDVYKRQPFATVSNTAQSWTTKCLIRRSMPMLPIKRRT